MRGLLAFVLLAGCKGKAADVDAPAPSSEVPTLPSVPPRDWDDTSPLLGFIGSPCDDDEDCVYEGGACLTEAQGFPGGTCSLACDRFCPDVAGYPATFCVDEVELPTVTDLGDGACLSRCDLRAWPETGCREGYGCAAQTRANEPQTQQLVCMPGVETALSPCVRDLLARGVAVSPTILADASPQGHPDLICHVEDPVVLHSPILGVDLYYVDAAAPTDVRGSCEMARALADTVEDLKPHGVTAVRHIGTYVCRTISGTNTLSRHAYGDAIDLWGFDFDDGTTVTLQDHWEMDTTAFATAEGAFLYDAAYRWFSYGFWHIVLTPIYNAAHWNHFHVDLTPGGSFIKSQPDRFFGPAPYDD